MGVLVAACVLALAGCSGEAERSATPSRSPGLAGLLIEPSMSAAEAVAGGEMSPQRLQLNGVSVALPRGWEVVTSPCGPPSHFGFVFTQRYASFRCPYFRHSRIAGTVGAYDRQALAGRQSREPMTATASVDGESMQETPLSCNQNGTCRVAFGSASHHAYFVVRVNGPSARATVKAIRDSVRFD